MHQKGERQGQLAQQREQQLLLLQQPAQVLPRLHLQVQVQAAHSLPATPNNSSSSLTQPSAPLSQATPCMPQQQQQSRKPQALMPAQHHHQQQQQGSSRRLKPSQKSSGWPSS